MPYAGNISRADKLRAPTGHDNSDSVRREAVRSRDQIVNRELDKAMKSAVRHIESHRRCRVVKLSAEYVVDDHDEVWLVRAQRIETANVPTRKRPRTVLESSLAPSDAAPTMPSPGLPILQSGGETPAFMTPMRRTSDLSQEAFMAASTSALPRFAPQVPSWADPLSMARSRSTGSVSAVSSAQLMSKMKQGKGRKKRQGKKKGAKAFALGSSQSASRGRRAKRQQ